MSPEGYHVPSSDAGTKTFKIGRLEDATWCGHPQWEQPYYHAYPDRTLYQKCKACGLARMVT